LSARAAPANPHARPQSSAAAVLREALQQSWLALTIAGLIAAACFYATGGLGLGSATTTEMLVTGGSGLLVAAAVTQTGAAQTRLWGGGSAIAFACLAAVTAFSVSWSVEPSYSWIEAGRTLSYAAAFAGAIALARLAAERWRSVLCGILLASLVVSVYAVGTKVFPAPGATFARLNAPFDYWNAVGLTAALGVPPALWLGSRREGHGAQIALAGPAICLLLFTLMLAYSRGALLALVVGLVFWFVVTPLRLRSAAVLAIGALGAAVVVIWTFAQHALTTDNASLAARDPAGRDLALLLVVVLSACAVSGLAVRFALARRPPSAQQRRRAGTALIVCLALVPLAGIVGLAASSRGLFGSISHDVSTLTNTHAAVSNSANRLTALGSARAEYWSAALQAFDTNPLIGTGAGGFQTAFLRYTKASNTTVAQAHSYPFQTLADLGIIGLLVSLALVAAWVAAALRAVRRSTLSHAHDGAGSAERIGLLTMITCVVVFAVHSTVDWTWFVPGVALTAILCAGWVAGRGPAAVSPAWGRPTLDALRAPRFALAASAALVMALMIAWSQWQPLRSQDSSNAAYTSITAGQVAGGTLAVADYTRAESQARAASAENPLDFWPLVWLADAQAHLHHLGIAYNSIVRAVELQPSNPQTWYELASFDAHELADPRAALRALDRALFLYPQYQFAQTLYLALEADLSSARVTPAGRHARPKH